jgi:hypothetical protein
MSPQGDKSSYSPKQRRQAGKIERSARSRGRPKKVAQRIAWATVNKQTGGAKGKRTARSRKAASRPKATRKSSTRKSSTRKSSARKSSARKGSGQGGRKSARKSR